MKGIVYVNIVVRVLWHFLSFGFFLLSSIYMGPGDKHWHFRGVLQQACLYFVESDTTQALETECSLKQLIMRVLADTSQKVEEG